MRAWELGTGILRIANGWRLDRGAIAATNATGASYGRPINRAKPQAIARAVTEIWRNEGFGSK